MHWAAQYIGRPYKRAAEGPDAYDCWGLARAVWLERLGLQMPQVNVGENNNVQAMRVIAGSLGWARVDGPARPYDALIMQAYGGRHIAVAIEAGNRIVYLHADERAGVEIIRTLGMFSEFGYKNIEVWRYASRI